MKTICIAVALSTGMVGIACDFASGQQQADAQASPSDRVLNVVPASAGKPFGEALPISTVSAQMFHSVLSPVHGKAAGINAEMAQCGSGFNEPIFHNQFVDSATPCFSYSAEVGGFVPRVQCCQFHPSNCGPIRPFIEPLRLRLRAIPCRY